MNPSAGDRQFPLDFDPVRMMRLTFPLNLFSFTLLRTDHRPNISLKINVLNHVLILKIKVAKKTDAHMR
jgi:hypothetical protein